MSMWPPEGLAGLRRSYQGQPLLEDDLPSTPADLFSQWFADAEASGVVEPNAMTLGTVGDDGRPASRTVLLKGLTAQGFVFYTNTGSRKARHMAAQPWVSLLFPWIPITRQVGVQGQVHRVPDEAADAYFASRPRGSQLGAWASRQSSVLPDRAALDAALAQVGERFGDGPVPRPPDWGGYEVRPVLVEFWQGQPSRLHDRLLFVSVDGRPASLGEAEGWRVERWSP
jgi:pyridoxamine 5'-phosphate oxidase